MKEPTEYTAVEEPPYGAFITELNGTAYLKPCYWAVIESAGGSESHIGISSLTIKDKETVVMKNQQ